MINIENENKIIRNLKNILLKIVNYFDKWD